MTAAGRQVITRHTRGGVLVFVHLQPGGGQIYVPVVPAWAGYSRPWPQQDQKRRG